jgi:hypothetical protein
MSPSLHTPEVYHAVSIRFLGLRHDLLVECASESEKMDDRMDFDIQKDFEIQYWIFRYRQQIVIDGN